MAFPVVASSSTSFQAAVAKPTGLAVGDLMVAYVVAVAYSNHNASAAAPDGTWTLIKLASISSDVQIASYYKFATSTDVAASTFAFGSGDGFSTALLRITGADLTTPVIASTTGNSSGTAFSAATMTPGFQSLYLLLAGEGNNSNVSPAISSPAIASNNPTWISVASRANAFSTDSTGINIFSAPSITAGGVATGAASASAASSASNTNLQLIAISPPNPTVAPSFFGGTFTYLTYVVNKAIVIGALFGMASTVLTATAGLVVAKVRNVQKHASTWKNKSKS